MRTSTVRRVEPIRNAVRKGIDEAARRAAERPEQLTLSLGKQQQRHLARLAEAMGLSFQTVVLAATKAGLFRLQELEPAERKALLAKRRSAGGATLSVDLTLDTLSRMDRAGVSRAQLPAVAIGGIELLYRGIIKSELAAP